MYPLSSQKAYPFGVDIANVHPSVNSRVRVMVRKNKNSVSRQGAMALMVLLSPVVRRPTTRDINVGGWYPQSCREEKVTRQLLLC